MINELSMRAVFELSVLASLLAVAAGALCGIAITGGSRKVTVVAACSSAALAVASFSLLGYLIT